MTASGAELPVLGHIRSFIQIGGIELLHTFVVVESLVASAILGVDFCMRMGWCLTLLKHQSESARPQWGLVQLLHCWRPHLMQWMSVQSLIFRKTSSVYVELHARMCGIRFNSQPFWKVSGPVPNKARCNRGHLSLYS